MYLRSRARQMFKDIKIQDFEKVKPIYNLSRTISTSDIFFHKYARREGKFMTKIMRGDDSKRKWFMNRPKLQSSGEGPKKAAPPPNMRRNTVLNKIFMKYITDLMATGEVASEILGKGVEITRVSVTPDFQFVNVFWLARDSGDKDQLVEESLTRAEGQLRHELSQLRVIGVVPPIKFVRDKEFARFVEIDQKLAVADFGDDFTPTDLTLKLRSTPVLTVKLPPDVLADIKKLEQDIEDSELEIVEETLPEMRNDVLGLDHHRIMTKVKNSMDKSSTAFMNRSLNIAIPLRQDAEQSSQVTEYLSVKQKHAAFTAFLTKRQVDEERRKKYAMDKNCDYKEDLDWHDDDDEFRNEYETFDLDDEVANIDMWPKKFEER